MRSCWKEEEMRRELPGGGGRSVSHCHWGSQRPGRGKTNRLALQEGEEKPQRANAAPLLPVLMS